MNKTMEERANRMRLEKESARASRKKERAELLPLLRQLNIFASGSPEFTIEFDGYGDSGMFYDVTPSIPNEDELTNRVQELLEGYGNDDQVVSWDWYNNDGGGGELVWDISKDVITINGHWNEIIANSVDEKEI
jgi:hypothetical protein